MQDVITQLEKLTQQVALLMEENALLREQIRLLKLKIFGRSKDVGLPDENQRPLFSDEELGIAAAPPEKREKISYERKKPGRKGIDEDLPRTVVEIDLAEEDKICGCGAKKERIGEEVAERVEYIPARIKVVRTVRPKYACKQCQGVEDDGPTVAIAPAPPVLMAKSIVTPSLMTHILVSKIADAIPFYRQEKQLARLGIAVHRGSMADWTIELAKRCRTLVDMLTEQALKRQSIQLDETTLQVMNEKKDKSTTNSYMWLLRAGPPKIGPPNHRVAYPDQPEIVLYWYKESRSTDWVKVLLKGYKGYIQTDDYGGYQFLSGKDAAHLEWHHVQCLAHVRRKFTDALATLPGQGAEKIRGLTQEMVGQLRDIFQAEREAADQAINEDDLVQRRIATVLPLLDGFEARVRVEKDVVVPKSLLGKALSYAAATLPAIKTYVQCPNLTLDNNSLENKVRPFAVGRKNWLFANTPEGAHALATWFSLVETAKANGWMPDQYLMWLLEGLRLNRPLESLLPTLPPPEKFSVEV